LERSALILVILPRSTAHVPILNDRSQVVGTIDVESERPNGFDKDTEQLLENCAVLLRPLFR
jgi:putative methionine-R-sulfoxide reductase with GAF domain